MSCPTCGHRKADGILCGSPALRGKQFCYFHQRDHQRQQHAARVLRRSDPLRPNAPLPKTPFDMQITLYELMNAIAGDRISLRRAGKLLVALQQTSASLRKPAEY